MQVRRLITALPQVWKIIKMGIQLIVFLEHKRTSEIGINENSTEFIKCATNSETNAEFVYQA